MRLTLAALTPIMAVAAAGPLAAGGVTAAPAATSRVVDRTFVCTPSYGRVTVVASPRGSSELQGARFTSSGYARVTSGPSSDPLSDLVVVARPGLRNSSSRFPAAVYASGRRCVASRSPVPLTRAGLPRAPVTWRSEAECTVRRRMLVRVRAVLSAPATWGRVGTAFAGVRGLVVEAELAVRDQVTGKPLAFVKLGRAGQTQLWSAPRCA